MEINTKDEPWFAEFANYLASDIIPKGMKYQQNNFFSRTSNTTFERSPTSLKYVLMKDCTSVRAEIEVLRSERLAYEQEGIQTRETLARSEAYCRALEARVAVLETHACRLEWQRQAADDFAVQHIMRTQALEAGACDDTLEDTEAVQTMIDQAFLRNFSGGDGSHSSHAENPRNMHIARPCYYADFMKCHPLNFKGTEGAVGLTRWIEKMESVFNISRCAVENQVEFATCTLLDATLTWWNNQIRTLGFDAYIMTWSALKKKMTDKYCPLGEVKKLEIELWNLKVRDNNIHAYTNCFQELALICTKFISNETEKVDKNNQQPFKRQNVAKAYNLGSAEKKTYEGNAPKDEWKCCGKSGLKCCHGYVPLK
nr:reverse transcriptase domain-containing protein [Tanacetum cinerariifolium]